MGQIKFVPTTVKALKSITPRLEYAPCGGIHLYLGDEDAEYLIVSIENDGRLIRHGEADKLGLPCDDYGNIEIGC